MNLIDDSLWSAKVVKKSDLNVPTLVEIQSDTFLKIDICLKSDICNKAQGEKVKRKQTEIHTAQVYHKINMLFYSRWKYTTYKHKQDPSILLF